MFKVFQFAFQLTIEFSKYLLWFAALITAADSR